MKFKIFAQRMEFYSAIVEADSADEARALGASGDAEWEPETWGGRGLGAEDYEVTGVEAEEEDEDDFCEACQQHRPCACDEMDADREGGAR